LGSDVLEEWRAILGEPENVDACRRVMKAIVGTIEVANHNAPNPEWLRRYSESGDPREVPGVMWRATVRANALGEPHIRLASPPGDEPHVVPEFLVKFGFFARRVSFRVRSAPRDSVDTAREPMRNEEFGYRYDLEHRVADESRTQTAATDNR
jgi:hypothetical protein